MGPTAWCNAHKSRLQNGVPILSHPSLSAGQVMRGNKVLGVSTGTRETKTGRGQAIAHDTNKDQSRLRLLLHKNARPFCVQSAKSESNPEVESFGVGAGVDRISPTPTPPRSCTLCLIN